MAINEAVSSMWQSAGWQKPMWRKRLWLAQLWRQQCNINVANQWQQNVVAAASAKYQLIMAYLINIWHGPAISGGMKSVIILKAGNQRNGVA